MPILSHSLFAIHSAVLLFALSGLFGKWLTLPAIVIVIGRAIFAAITLWLVMVSVKRQDWRVSRSTLLPLIFTGIILAVHWASFFQAIQVSTVAIGLITFATFPVFVSLLEPWFFKESFHYSTLIQGLLTMVGVALVLPLSQLNDSVFEGIFWGTVSALTFAFLTLLNRKFVTNVSATKVAFYQNGFAGLSLLPFLIVNPVEITGEQWLILVLLGVVFTALSHTLFNYSLKGIKAQTASIAVSLEPIYAIVAAYFLLDERLTLLMVVGGALVVAVNVWSVRTTRAIKLN
ncbi:DMT family transporter [Thalassotalea ganghwensis]